MAEVEHGIYFIEEIAKGSYKIYERREATMYLVCGNEKACLIDTAYGLTDLKALAHELTVLPVSVVNTHAHVDHVLGNHWFYENEDTRVYMHPADTPIYDAVVSGYVEMLRQPWVKEAYGEFIAKLDPDAVRFPKTQDVREGDVIDLGGKKLEIYEIPGHTAGSILLLDREEKICYAGDAIVDNLWMFMPECCPNEVCLASLRHAFEVLSEAGVERIYNGHFYHEPITLQRLKNMIEGMEQVVSGTAQGEPFENDKGKGTRYTFGDWNVLCRDENI